MIFFQAYGVSLVFVMCIFKCYGLGVVSIVLGSFCCFVIGVWGVGFCVVDRIVVLVGVGWGLFECM